MAYRWRIRHKLILGMALVVGIMAFMIAGTFKGLTAAKSAMGTIDSKIFELQLADKVRDDIKVLARADQIGLVKAAGKNALQDVLNYKQFIEEGHAKHKDRYKSFLQYPFLPALEKKLLLLLETLPEPNAPRVVDATTQSWENEIFHPRNKVRGMIDSIVIASADLSSTINDELKDIINHSKKNYQSSIILLIGTGAVALVFMIGLLRFFYQGVVKPIRALELNVNRVAKGDFEHPIVIKSGDEIEDFSVALNDMTSRLRDMYQDLAQQVNERSRQLVRSEQLAGVGFLAAGVAHEINNPLASIAFCGEALEGRIAELFEHQYSRDPQEREIITKYLKMIQEEAFRCKEITQKLLAFSRGGKSRREKMDLVQILQGVLDVVQHLQNSKGKQVVLECKEPLETWVNGQEIKQVFLNLTVNALESMDDGGTLTISPALRHGMIELRFKDTGCGMSTEVLNNIFEPFFTRSKTGKGTGLGLSISHRIITQHGGEIEANSTGPDQGSTFTVKLPLDPPKENNEDGPEGLDPEEEFLKLTAAKRAAA